ncbi:MAG: AAA family ATPase, partial [Bacteroidales bacterium]|nr:AAA family ATPase [Bacteroidales bacterium]
MHLDSIRLTNFKNIASAEVSCCPKINCITGDNGTGKTSLLDAIHYLSMTKSYFNSSDLHAYRYGESVTSIVGTYINNDGTSEHITVSLKKGEEKQVRRGQKAYKKFSEHIGLIPIVMTSSYDISL